METVLETRTSRSGDLVHLEALERCPGCGSTDLAFACSAEDVVLGTGKYRVDECRSCTLAFLNPRPVEADVPTTNQHSEPLPTKQTLLTAVRRRRLAARARDYLKHARGERLQCLDVGCGDGFFADAVASLENVEHVVASDYMPSAPPFLRERAAVTTKVSYAQNEETFARSEAFDVVFCRHVLEHVHRPTEWLGKLRGLLRPGGLLVLEVPRWDAVWRDVFGADYSHISPPAHVNQYTQRALESQLVGFEVAAWGQTHGIVLGRSLMQKFSSKHIDATAPLALATFPLEIVVERLSGRWACLTCVARKA